MALLTKKSLQGLVPMKLYLEHLFPAPADMLSGVRPICVRVTLIFLFTFDHTLWLFYGFVASSFAKIDVCVIANRSVSKPLPMNNHDSLWKIMCIEVTCGFVASSCVGYGRWMCQNFRWKHYQACPRHTCRQSHKVWPPNRLRIVGETYWAVGYNAELMCRSHGWPGWSHTSFKGSWLPGSSVAVCGTLAFHYPPTRQVGKSSLPHTCGYSANLRVFP